MDPRIGTAARLQQAKNYPAAEKLYREILAAQPKNADALLLLGLLLHETGRHEQSVESLRRALRSQPNQPEIRQTLVGSLVALGRVPDAIVEAREVVRLKPMTAESHFALSNLLYRNNDFAAAVPAINRSIELNPRFGPAFALQTRILIMLQRLNEALKAADRALAIEPSQIDVIIDRAYLLRELGRIDESIVCHEAALKLAPDNMAALNNLGTCFLLKSRHVDAIRCFETAARLAPENAKLRNNIGAVLREAGRHDEAIPHFEMTLQLDPNYGEAASNLANSLAILGLHERAIAWYRKALQISPTLTSAYSNMLFTMVAAPDAVEEAIYAEHTEFGRRYSDPLQPTIPTIEIDRTPDRRLRIGYVSPDFREHSVRYFIEPIIAAHDRTQVEVICFQTGIRRDEMTERLSGLADQWHRATGLTDDQFTDLIRQQRIDILVDLAGHTAENSLPVFARRPAPVQVTYLGYPATTGMKSIDYRLTDAIADPPGADAFYTEKLVRLPKAFFVFEADERLPYDPGLPADRNGFVTFGSFNNFGKIHPALLDAWADILTAVPTSRLLMKSKSLDNPSTQQVVRDVFTRRGIGMDRIDLRSWVPLEEHHAMLRNLDLMLDSFPYNGHTTSCQSIWMGAAVLTRAGETFRSRVGLSMMTQLDLPDFVAASREQYVRKAIELATDLTRLRQLRPTLRQRMAASSLCDAPGFCRELEHRYREMWRLRIQETEATK